jgi:hypothetical protein
MRRLTSVILGAILSLALASTAQAQLALGIRAGWNSSGMIVNEGGASVSQFDRLNGFHAGADLTIGVASNMGILIGGVYSQKGGKEQSSDLKLAVDYIDVPLLFVFTIPSSGSVTPRLFIGAVGSFEMSCKIKDSSGSVDCSDDEIGAREKFYLSGLGGAGIAFAAGPGSLLLDAGFQLGLTDISNETDLTVKINTIQVSLGYQFPLGG